MTNKPTKQISFNAISKYRTFLMGLAIISIILFHFTSDCVNNNYNLKTIIIYYQNYFGSCGVDIFLFLSGFGLYYSFKNNNDINLFFRKRFSRILIPYFLIAIPSWFLKDIYVQKLGIMQFLKDLLFLTFFENGERRFWYILMIAICYLIFPHVFHYIDSTGSINKIINIFMLTTVMSIMLDLYCHNLFSNISIALPRFPAFFLGCFVGKASYHNLKVPKESLIVPLMSVLLLIIKEQSTSILSRYILGIFGISTFICIAFLLEELSKIKLYDYCLPFKKTIEWFGSYSLELYLTHVSIRYIIIYLGYPVYRLRNEFLLIALSLITSILLKKITNHIIKHHIK